MMGLSRREARRRLGSVLDFAELNEFVDLKLKNYSSGMMVRLAFAVMVEADADIMLVDEVLAVGDAEFQKKCLGKMGDASQQEGRTVILVSHQMNAVERLCSRALLIDKGTLRMESADVRSVIHSYLSGGEATTAISTRAEWRNAGDEFNNPWFQPQHLFLADARGAPLKMPVGLDTETWLHIEADVKTLDPGLAVGYSLYAESGELLYRSYQTDGREEEWPRLQLGRVVLRGRIPLRVLNEGVYRLELSGALHFRQWIFEPGAADPCVFLTLQGGLSESPMWPGKRPGLLAPFVPWELWEQ
jgi:lipopolysaccharide transport system ATP-binding protein